MVTQSIAVIIFSDQLSVLVDLYGEFGERVRHVLVTNAANVVHHECSYKLFLELTRLIYILRHACGKLKNS